MSEFPTELRLRNTGIINEQEGFGIIFTTTGSGYHKEPYVRKDISDTRIAELEAQVNRVCEWTKIRIYAGEEVYSTQCSPDFSYVGVIITPHCPNCGGKIKEALKEVDGE